jgi:hypothetical protein
MFQAGFGQLGAAQHTSDLLGSLGVLHAANLGLRTSAFFGFFDQEVLVPEGGNLWQVSDAQNLLAFG